jgi:hypothetical protein
MELPPHPDTTGSAGNQQRPTTTSWSTIVIVAVVAIVLVGMVVLHLTGVVGPAGD